MIINKSRDVYITSVSMTSVVVYKLDLVKYFSKFTKEIKLSLRFAFQSNIVVIRIAMALKEKLTVYMLLNCKDILKVAVSPLKINLLIFL